MSDDIIGDAVRRYYEKFRAELPSKGGGNLPRWDALTADQLDAWMSAFAAAVEVSRATGRAMILTGLRQDGTAP